jgi:hypothetical protein
LDCCPFGGIKVLGLKTNKKVKKKDKKGGDVPSSSCISAQE